VTGHLAINFVRRHAWEILGAKKIRCLPSAGWFQCYYLVPSLGIS